jgi:hypothetical protein
MSEAHLIVGRMMDCQFMTDKEREKDGKWRDKAEETLKERRRRLGGWELILSLGDVHLYVVSPAGAPGRYCVLCVFTAV